MATGNVKGFSGRLETIDALRGIASFSVACFHLSEHGTALPSMGLLTWFMLHGRSGVEIFFVISGFILPWSLDRAGYTLDRWGRFLLKRVIRIDPPYLAMIAVVLALDCLSRNVPGLAGAGPFIGWPLVFGHVAFLNGFFGHTWLSPVFWTLAVEFQYYLLIGLLFPLAASSSRVNRLGLAIVCLILALLFPEVPMGQFGSLFVVGIAVFQYKSGRTGLLEYIPIVLAGCLVTGYLNEPVYGVVGLATALIIPFVRLSSRPLLWLGEISYSLYLVHTTIGGKVVHLGKKLPQTPLIEWAVFGAAMAASFAAALLLFHYVEKPARQWASRISIKPKPARAMAAVQSQ